MGNYISDDTPIAMLTVGQLKKVLGTTAVQSLQTPAKEENGYVYGVSGIAKIFDCSMTTASKIKASGKIDKAIIQVGRKIIVNVDLALELAGKKTGGRK